MTEGAGGGSFGTDDDDAAAREKEIAEAQSYLDAIGIEDFLAKKYSGRERDLSQEPSEAQCRAVEKLSRNIFLSSSITRGGGSASGNGAGGGGGAEDEGSNASAANFDILSAPRMIIHQGKLLKKSSHSLVQHNQKRFLFLLNDVLLITSVQSSATALVIKNNEKYEIHHVVPLNKLNVDDMSYLEPHETNSFLIIFGNHVMEFLTESESEKRIWIEKIIYAIHSTLFTKMSASERALFPPGWQHTVHRGTLHSAACLGEVEQVKLHLALLGDRPADVMDDVGMTPMHWAALMGHTQIIHLLLLKGCEVDSMNNVLNSSLILAAAGGHDHAMSILLERGADPFLRNLKDRDALFIASVFAPQSKSLASVFSLLNFRGVDFNKLDSSGATPLHECAARNLARSVRLLIEAGADVNIKHRTKFATPLLFACASRPPDVETVRTLLEKGAFPNWRDARNMTAFDYVLRGQMVASGKPASGGTDRAAGRKSFSTSPASSSDPASVARDQMELTLKDVGAFVVEALPVLIEIARRGGRYTDDSIKNLRPSLISAIDSGRTSWFKMEEAPCFADFVAARGSLIVGSESWHSNRSSDACLMCLSKFTYFSKHHCRACGILCCQDCSTKRLHLTAVRDSPEGARVCDSCFNRLGAEAEARMLALAKAQKYMLINDEPLPPPAPTSPSAASSDAVARPMSPVSDVASVSSGDGSISNTVSTVPSSLKASKSSDQLSRLSNTNSSTINTTKALNEVGEALQERGMRLQTTAEKAQSLAEGASEFGRMSRQLKESMKKKKERGGF